MATAQYDGAAGTVGSLAVYKNSFNLRIWADNCQSSLGFQDISRPNLGLVNSGTDVDACGRAGDGRVLSLGDRGEAILEFSEHLRDGAGYDLVVFENGFSDSFLELAFVEISSNGIDFYRFESVSLSDTSAQIATFGAVNPEKIHNLAGKYRANYGVGFDFSELANKANLDIQSVRWVKIISITGSINPDFADRDSRGNIINEPFPTPFITGGFDLDAVAGVYPQSFTDVDEQVSNQADNSPFRAHYQPQRAEILLFGGKNIIGSELFGQLITFQLYTQQGQLIQQGEFSPQAQNTIPVQPLPTAVYYLNLQRGSEFIQTLKIIPTP